MQWRQPGSTYVANPPYFEGMTMTPASDWATSIEATPYLAILGDSITTDHISPGRFDQGGLARGQAYLMEHQVAANRFQLSMARAAAITM